MRKPSDQKARGLLPITRSQSVASALNTRTGATPSRLRYTNMQIQIAQLKPDISTSLRIGRFYFALTQPFTSGEIGLYKVHVLIQRLNVFWGLNWVAIPTQVRSGRDIPEVDFVISCVDTRAARRTLARMVRLKTGRFPYWLDLGNNASSGQFVLGEPLRPNRKDRGLRLPCVDELFPQIIDPKRDARDSLPLAARLNLSFDRSHTSIR